MVMTAERYTVAVSVEGSDLRLVLRSPVRCTVSEDNTAMDVIGGAESAVGSLLAGQPLGMVRLAWSDQHGALTGQQIQAARLLEPPEIDVASMAMSLRLGGPFVVDI